LLVLKLIVIVPVIVPVIDINITIKKVRRKRQMSYFGKILDFWGFLWGEKTGRKKKFHPAYPLARVS
ncbi:MAG: hypothetical protein MUP11_09605, partial [Anaerolineales bacterium]|nr:hypothetical protein [Anaerolineales bacterium]